MLSQPVTETNKAVCADADAAPPSSFEQPLAEAETLVNDIKRVLVRSESALENEGIRTEMEVLERWMESYRRGLSAANKLANSGGEILHKLEEQLKLAISEQQRLDDEGGNPPSKEQAAALEEVSKALRRLEGLIPVFEGKFGSQPGEPEDQEIKPA